MKFLMFFACTFLLVCSSSGQTSIATVHLPITGYYVLPYQVEPVQAFTNLLMINTYDGSIVYYETSYNLIDSPIFASQSLNVAIYANDLPASNSINIVDSDTSISSYYGDGLLLPATWSSDDNTLIYRYFDFGLYAIREIDLATSAETTILEYPEDMEVTFPANHLSPAPTSFRVTRIASVDQNPVYEDWLVIQLEASYSLSDFDETYRTAFALLYNKFDRSMLILNPLFGSEPLTGIKSEWSENGRYLYFRLTDYKKVAIVSFDPATLTMNIVESYSVNQLDDPSPVIVDWLDISDLFLMIDSRGYLIGQIIDGELTTQQFFNLDSETLGISTAQVGDWKFTGTPEEAAQISCIFDETLPTRMEVGGQAQVAFTDGTASHLRSEPSTWSDVVQYVPEGTRFSIIGGFMCGSGYRWWQVQLGDDTQGWIAEASETEYWIEPLSTN